MVSVLVLFTYDFSSLPEVLALCQISGLGLMTAHIPQHDPDQRCRSTADKNGGWHHFPKSKWATIAIIVLSLAVIAFVLFSILQTANENGHTDADFGLHTTDHVRCGGANV
jgi:hypothetical protein